MQIGGIVFYDGRPYILRGLDPASVSPRQAYIEDTRTGSQIPVPLDEVEPIPEES